MSTVTAKRAPIVRTKPMRHPDVSSKSVMSRRGWWLVILGFLIPGSAQVLAGNRKLGRLGLVATLTMWVLGIVALALFLFSKSTMLILVEQTWLLFVIRALLIAYAVLWLVLAIDTLRLVKFVRARPNARIGIAVLATALMVVSSGGALYAANLVGITGETLDDVFADGPVADPVDGHYNILLLGADSGEGRDSMRFDSISVASVNAETGQVTMFGIPRDMPNVPFSAGPMQDLYPNGYEGHSDPDCGWEGKINQLNTELELCRDGHAIYPGAEADGSTPGIEATRDAAEGVLGLEIQYYAFIDMDHFAALIDALGGVEINVLERLPKGGGPAYDGQSAEEWADGWIEAGVQRMDGQTAQWYARSRYTTSDWDRMRRQRELQGAILAQFDPQTVLLRFQDVAQAGASMVKTNLPKGLLSRLATIALDSQKLQMQSVELVPPLVDADYPDYEAVHQLVQDTLHPPTEAPTDEEGGEG